MMKILFVCKHNRFRSKVAEAIFNKLNRNKNIKADSAGIQLDLEHDYIEPVVRKIMREKEYEIKGKPKLINSDYFDYDLIVIAADNVKLDSFPDFSGRIIWWKIKDVSANDEKKIRETINEIKEKVKKLIDSLE